VTVKQARLILWTCFGVVALTALAVFVLLPRLRPPTPIALGPSVVLSAPFRLVNQHGREVVEAEFRGKPTAWFFGFTHCPDVCPTTLMHMTGHLKSLGADADNLNAVFVTVDPERDTPEVLKEYLSSFDPRIVGLTGSPEEIQRFAKGYHVFFAKVPQAEGYTMNHTSLILLTDGDGRFKGTLDLHEPIDAQLQKLKRLAREGRYG
jgi:protein SCO1